MKFYIKFWAQVADLISCCLKINVFYNEKTATYFDDEKKNYLL